MKLVERVTKHYNALSANDLAIWKYISNNSKLCEKSSIELLAKNCHVSKTTILRFAKRIGLSGYSELKLLLKMENIEETTVISSIEKIQAGYNKYINNIKKNDLSEVAKLLHHAENIYVHAKGAVQRSVADELYRTFLHINKLLYRIKTSGETDHYEQNIKMNDVVIIISFSGNSEGSIEFVKKIKLKGTKVVAITATKENALQNICDHGIYIEPIIIRDIKGTEYKCLAEYFILIDILFVTYLDYIKALEAIDDEY